MVLACKFYNNQHFNLVFSTFSVRATTSARMATSTYVSHMATAGSATRGHNLGTSPSAVVPQDNDSRGHGFAVLVTSLSLSGTAASSKRSA